MPNPAEADTISETIGKTGPVLCLELSLKSGKKSQMALLALPGCPPEDWPRRMTESGPMDFAGQPAPALTLIAVGPQSEHINPACHFDFLSDLVRRTDGDPGQWLDSPGDFPLMQELAGRPNTLVTGKIAAEFLSALMNGTVARRSWRQGVTIIDASSDAILAFLVYRNRVYGVYGQRFDQLSPRQLAHDLKEFRFGWLPDEEVRSNGGFGCTLLQPVPPEAEAFVPTFITGYDHPLLQGLGKKLPDRTGPHGQNWNACLGLLFGLSLRHG